MSLQVIQVTDGETTVPWLLSWQEWPLASITFTGYASPTLKMCLLYRELFSPHFCVLQWPWLQLICVTSSMWAHRLFLDILFPFGKNPVGVARPFLCAIATRFCTWAQRGAWAFGGDPVSRRQYTHTAHWVYVDSITVFYKGNGTLAVGYETHVMSSIGVHLCVC